MDLTRIARGGTPIQLDKLRVLFFDKQATWLIIQRYGMRFVTALYSAKAQQPGKPVELQLKDIDALAFFLWAGLQAEATSKGENLTLEESEAFLVPFKVENIFNSVIVALTRSIDTPAVGDSDTGSPGKADAAAARPVAVARPKGPGPTKASTLLTRSASPTRSSGKRPKSSGRPR